MPIKQELPGMFVTELESYEAVVLKDEMFNIPEFDEVTKTPSF